MKRELVSTAARYWIVIVMVFVMGASIGYWHGIRESAALVAKALNTEEKMERSKGYSEMVAELVTGNGSHTAEELEIAARRDAGIASVPAPYKEGLTKAQQAYVDMDRTYHEMLKPFFDQLKAARRAVVDESGIGGMFQDEEGVVYQIAEKKGQWVAFEPVEINRTRRNGETKGSLSLTAARDAGFAVEGK